jgi:hypothetical protein
VHQGCVSDIVVCSVGGAWTISRNQQWWSVALAATATGPKQALGETVSKSPLLLLLSASAAAAAPAAASWLLLRRPVERDALPRSERDRDREREGDPEEEFQDAQVCMPQASVPDIGQCIVGWLLFFCRVLVSAAATHNDQIGMGQLDTLLCVCLLCLRVLQDALEELAEQEQEEEELEEVGAGHCCCL